MSRQATFTLHLRIPEWTTNPKVSINREEVGLSVNNGIGTINRKWKNRDSLLLELPMELRTLKWHKGAHAIERGPLVYSLKIESEEKTKNRNDGYGKFIEVYPQEDWNFALLQSGLDDLSSLITVTENDWDGSYPWNLKNAPITLKMQAKRLPEWELVYGAPQLPDPEVLRNSSTYKTEVISLFPNGFTTLRITEFPVVK